MSKQSLASLSVKAYRLSSMDDRFMAVSKRITRVLLTPELYAQLLSTQPSTRL